MLRVWAVVVAMVVFVGIHCAAMGQTIPAGIEAKVYRWMQLQQGKHGILGNQDNDALAGLYPNALAAMCFIHQGEIERGERVLDFYNKSFADLFSPDKPGGVPQFANAESGELSMEADRWIGDNAWLLIALNYHRRQTGKTTYDPMRLALARWLLGLQDDNGGVKSGFNKDGEMTAYSTEGNLDCYAAWVDYPEARARVLGFLKNEMYVAGAEGDHFKMGSTVSEPALDTCSWAVTALGPEYAKTFAYTQKRFGRTDRCEGSGQTITAFADFVDKQRIWLEGSGEMAVAYIVAGRKQEAQNCIAELEKATVSSTAHPGTVGLPCSSSDPSWKGASTLPFTPSQAWYLFAKWGFNPMR